MAAYKSNSSTSDEDGVEMGLNNGAMGEEFREDREVGEPFRAVEWSTGGILLKSNSKLLDSLTGVKLRFLVAEDRDTGDSRGCLDEELCGEDL